MKNNHNGENFCLFEDYICKNKYLIFAVFSFSNIFINYACLIISTSFYITFLMLARREIIGPLERNMLL